MQVLRRRTAVCAPAPVRDRRLTVARHRCSTAPRECGAGAAAGSRRRLADREGLLAAAVPAAQRRLHHRAGRTAFFLAIAFSLSDVTAGDPGFDWVGFRNFQRIFDDPVFWTSLRNTLRLHRDFDGPHRDLREGPGATSWSPISGASGSCGSCVCCPGPRRSSLSTIAWLWMLDSIYSPIDWLLRQAGLIEGNVYWLGRPHLAMALGHRRARLASGAARRGHHDGRSRRHPQGGQEQAKVDGAGYWRRLFEITIPLMLPVIAVAALFGAIFTFTDMAVVYILTRGGPRTRPRCWPAGRSSRGSKAATSARAPRSRCSSSRCCSPRRSRSCVGAPYGGAVTAARRPRRARRRWRHSGGVRSTGTCWPGRPLRIGGASPRSSRAGPFIWAAYHRLQAGCGSLQPGQHPVRLQLEPTFDHIRYLFDDTAFLTFVWNTVWVGLVGRRNHSGAGAARCVQSGAAQPARGPARWPWPSSWSIWSRRACCSCR